jgi:hypothetical protein
MGIVHVFSYSVKGVPDNSAKRSGEATCLGSERVTQYLDVVCEFVCEKPSKDSKNRLK